LADFKKLIELITNTVEGFNNSIPGIQKKMLDELLLLTKKLDIKGENISISGSNIKLLAQLQSKLQNIILNPEYIEKVKNYVFSFNQVVSLQHDYFTEITDKFKPPKLASELKKQAVSGVINNLTENGLNANIIDKVKEILRKSITTGGSYASLNQSLTDFIINNKSGDGHLIKYTKQITTDALNQFSGQYTQIISSDLGYEWFRYSGSNIETTRPFCLACTDRKYFHISELPNVLKGKFEEFIKYGGTVNPKTDLPYGFIPNTDVSNFMINRGGYNCGHQWRPVSEDLVPEEIKRKVYNSFEYRNWAKKNGKELLPIVPIEVNKEQAKKETKNTNKVDLDSYGEIKDIYDVNDLLIKQKDSIADWFNNTDFKKLTITTNPNLNGSTDMNGKISLSSEKGRLFAIALNNIKNKIDLDLDHEKAISTFWHEIWHNRNKDISIVITNTQRNYMELGNEFVSRNTLDEIFTALGTKLKNTDLRKNRPDTFYNKWVRNYDKAIEYFGAEHNKVVDFMIDKMKNGDYNSVKNYLVQAIANTNKDLKVKEIKKAVMDAILLTEKEYAEKYIIR
jgi:hypothetical protein